MSNPYSCLRFETVVARGQARHGARVCESGWSLAELSECTSLQGHPGIWYGLHCACGRSAHDSQPSVRLPDGTEAQNYR